MTSAAPRRSFRGASIAATVVLLGAWVAASAAINRGIILPDPVATLSALARLAGDGSFYVALSATVLRAFAAFAISYSVGGALGLLAARFPFARGALSPVVVVIRSTPVVAIILLAMIWISAGGVAILVSVLMTLPIVYESLRRGLAEIDPDLLEMGRSFSVSSRQLITHVYVPSLRPFLLTGAASALGITWKVIVAAEVLAQPQHGIGTSMQVSRTNLMTAEVFALTLVAILLSGLSEGVLNALAKRRRGSRGEKRQSQRRRAVANRPSPSKRRSGTDVELTGKAMTKSFESLLLLRDLDFRPEAGKTTVLLGPSGCGKTTLLRCLAGLLPLDSGTVVGQGDARLGFVFQSPRLLPWRTAQENVQFVPKGAGSLVDTDGDSDARQVLAALGIGSSAELLPTELSGGMSRRVTLARALYYGAEILLLDEPFQGLDFARRWDLTRLFRDVIDTAGATVVMVTHDVREALLMGDRIVIVDGPPLHVLRDYANPVAKDTRSPWDEAISIEEARILSLLLARGEPTAPADETRTEE